MSQKTVLIAEDEEFLVKLLATSLHKHEVEVLTASNGGEAIQMLQEGTPDLMLLDLMMPEVDGFEVLTAIKEKGYSTPVIIFSNLSQDIDHDKCIALGAMDYFVKGEMEINEVIEKVLFYLSEEKQ